ncbi:MAG: ABC transporter permease [Ferrovibrionaceae bacterium]
MNARPRLAPSEVVAVLWRDRSLVSRLVRREIAARYTGTLFGAAWTVVTPLIMLAIYTFMFGVIFPVRWTVPEQAGTGHFALILFTGLILFNFFAECVTRSPGLVLENVAYVKKVVFPLEIMPWVAALQAGFNALIAFAVLLLAHLWLVGLPPLSALAVPLTVLPLVLITLGLTWILASLGVFLRDIKQLVALLTTGLMFLTPIFYPSSAIPPDYLWAVDLNPIAPAIEATRDCLIFGKWPDWLALVRHLVVGYAVAWIGLVWFLKTKKGFADVI